MGIIKVDSGTIILNNKEIQNEPVTYRSKLGLLMMQEEVSLIFQLKIIYTQLQKY